MVSDYMMFRPVLTSFLAAVLCATSSLASAGPADLKHFVSELRSFSAGFEQTVVNEQGAIQQRAKGHVWLDKPGRFRWDYSEPFRQTLVGDGRRIWSFDPELEQAVVKPFEGFENTTSAVLLNGATDLDRLFTIEGEGENKGSRRIFDLRPRSEEDEIREVRIGFAVAGIPEFLEFTDVLGQTTRIEFHGVKRNPKLDPATFRFIPPEGTDVVGDPG